MASFTGAPLGGFVGGLIVSLLLGRGFDWPVIFILGGAFPLILLPILALWLPESPRFLARSQICLCGEQHYSRVLVSLGSKPIHRCPTSPAVIRSRCCSAKAMRCRP
jgi:MFS family permease